ncbi:MAG: type II secretion system GspH family protein [Alphaproteobacteria bacterium]|nr:type II secretion system GspH family protein [Alphaproteobacteria bacterium]
MTTHSSPSTSPSHCKRYKQSGVTLVELSIVLVILALLTGGIVSGVAMLRSTEFRKVFSEFQQFQMAISTFNTKYDDLPGDTTDATAIWGMAPNASSPAVSDAACAALTSSSPSQGTRTCNGDGDGAIAVGYEEYRAWQQLSNANMIDGNYTGVGSTASAGEGHQTGINCPKSAFRDGCWRVFFRDSTDAQRDPFYLFEGNYDTHLFSIWGGSNTLNNFTPLFTPAEIWELDNKLDDGNPATGAIVVPHATGVGNPFAGCSLTTLGAATDENDVDAIYNTNGKDRVCQIYIKADF